MCVSHRHRRLISLKLYIYIYSVKFAQSVKVIKLQIIQSESRHYTCTYIYYTLYVQICNSKSVLVISMCIRIQIIVYMHRYAYCVQQLLKTCIPIILQLVPLAYTPCTQMRLHELESSPRYEK